MIYLNSALQTVKPSATLQINERISEMRKSGEQIIHFGFGQSPFSVPTAIVERLKRYSHLNNYLPSLGLPELRTKIAHFISKNQGIPLSPDQVLVGPGSKELLFQSILMLDGLFIIPTGSWVSYLPQVELNSKNALKLVTNIESDFKILPEQLDELCKSYKDHPKILILNSPNNPTGAVYSDSELKELSKVCRLYDLIVLSDEIYSQLSFNSEYAPSMANYYPEGTFVFGGMSKVFAAGGYRLGFAVVPEELNYLVDHFKVIFSETFSAVSAPIQHAAIEAYSYGPEIEKSVQDSSKILAKIGLYVYDELRINGIECTKPEGGFYLIIGFNKFKDRISGLGVHSSADLANFLLSDHKIALLPGSDFNLDASDLWFRLAFVDFDGARVLEYFQKTQNVVIDSKFIQTFAPNIYSGVQRLVDFVRSMES